MGKGSKAPKSPDYTDVINLFKDVASYAKQNSQDMMTWAKNAYAENKGVSDKVINNALDWMSTMSGWSKEDRERYKSTFQPLEDALVKEAQSYASPERQQYEAGKAEADVAQQFAAARQTASDKLKDYGVDPSQTRQGALDLGTRVAEAAAQSSAGNQARWHAEDVGRALRSEALGIGTGTANRSLSESSASGQAGNQAANTGLATTASGADTMGTPTQWSSIQSGAGSSWGDMLSQDYQNRMAKYEADQKSSSGWGSVLGTLAGTALKFVPGFAEGGAIPDDGMSVPPEASPSGGAIPDDVPAQIDGQAPAQLNAGEFVVPKDVTKWMGEKGLQQMILKARKEMTGGNGERPAQPNVGPPGGIPPGTPPEGVGAIPSPVG